MLRHTNESKLFILYAVFHRKLSEEVHHQNEGINEKRKTGFRKWDIQHERGEEQPIQISIGQRAPGEMSLKKEKNKARLHDVFEPTKKLKLPEGS